MSRFPAILVLAVSLALAGCGAKASGQPALRPPGERPPVPSILAQPPPGVRLRAPAEAILGDQVIGSARRSGSDHLTAAEAASQEPDEGVALAAYTSWGWLDGASRTWATADETLVTTARADGAAHAFAAWSQGAGGACPPAVASGLDDCREGVTGDRATVVGRLATAVFRLHCPVAAADRLVLAQIASLHA
jgi:hypothetical protein